ncbi:MAG: 3-dehydro-L-gulonate 2-dehydrogenase [Lachnospiraceae bacterium]|nr:3-dehydro-L-gulonate 2-dehydrogenase [Lachnospiraceae bacterium]
MRVSFEELKTAIKNVLIRYGVSEEKADVLAQIHTETTYDGIYSHGSGRVARFVEYLTKGWVDPNAEPTVEKEMGAIRVLNGNMGPGVLNALYGVEEAMKLADEYGIGLVGLKNTTHWMRGGTYGKIAAEKGYVAIMWTNTESVMPPWGGKNPKLGNNPIVFAAPKGDGEEIFLLDMAVAQYSYGKLSTLKLAGKKLPFAGGYDEEGNLTDDPAAIEKTRRMLPIGYWKGSGLAFMLDILAVMLTDGIGAGDLDVKGKGSCGGCSQVMIVIDPSRMIDGNRLRIEVEKAIAHIQEAERVDERSSIHAPGDGMKRYHEEHDREGIFVDDRVWEQINSL